MTSMDANKSVQVSFSLYDYGAGTSRPYPCDIYRDVVPSPVRTEWVPQSIVDSIWVLYEFASEEDRDKFISSPPPSFDAARIVKVDQQFLDHWSK